MKGMDLIPAGFVSRQRGTLYIVYPDTPIKVCTHYLKGGKRIGYRPDQLFLDTVTPVYTTFEPWDKKALSAATNKNSLPKEALAFIAAVETALESPVRMITTGARRDQSVQLLG